LPDGDAAKWDGIEKCPAAEISEAQLRQSLPAEVVDEKREPTQDELKTAAIPFLSGYGKCLSAAAISNSGKEKILSFLESDFIASMSKK